MGSRSDWETMKHTDATLTTSPCLMFAESSRHTAHRTSWLSSPNRECGRTASTSSSPLPAALPTCPGWSPRTQPFPMRVPIESAVLHGVDSLLSIVQMPGGIPVGTLAIGKAGAINAALLAVAILGNSRPEFRLQLEEFRKRQTQKVLEDKLGVNRPILPGPPLVSLAAANWAACSPSRPVEHGLPRPYAFPGR